MAFEFSSGIVLTWIHLAVLLAGLPLLVTWIARLIEQRGLGLPVDGAWGDVCWGRVAGGFEFVIVCVAVHLLLSTGLSFCLGPLDLPHWSDGAAAGLVQALAMCGQWAVTCGLLLAWVLLHARGRLATVGLTASRFWKSLAAGAAGFLAIMPAVLVALFTAWFIYQLFNAEPPGEHPVLAAVSQSRDPWMIAAYFVVAGLLIPFFEELFYRGLIQTTLMRTGSAAMAIVLTSLLFGLAHLPMDNGPVGAPAVTVLALGLGYVYYRTRSLWAPVTLHALFNLYNLTLTVAAPALTEYLNRL